MRLESYRTFHKTIGRIRLLYEVTIHSYNLMYTEGRQRLKDTTQTNASVQIQLDHQSIKRPLKVLTYHAKDVYPDLLRSTLLVRIIAAFEAYLVDTIEEVAARSDIPFESNKIIEITHKHLLNLTKKNSVKSFLVKNTTRQLTSSGFDEIRKFYKTSFSIEIPAPGTPLNEIKEIHNRRHLYVHSGGYADEGYIHQHPDSSVAVGDLLPVGEQYLLSALDILGKTALHIKKSVELKYSEPPKWQYINGNQTLTAPSEQLVIVSANTSNPDKLYSLFDLSINLPNETILKNITVWRAMDGSRVRWLLGGAQRDISSFFRLLNTMQSENTIYNIESFKVNR